MIRHARRVSVLVAFYLLTSAATAHADCAWVLWTKNCCSSYGNYWARHDAFDTRAQCVSFLDRADVPANSPHRRSETSLVTGFGKGEDAVAFLQCLPDTVDPRGPKGK